MPKTILVLEDEQPLLKAIADKLRLSGFEVISAREVDQALDYFKQMPIDCVWLDHYLLGKKNGLDFIVELKAQEKYKKVPIYVVSNTATPDKIDSYLGLGVEKYFTKSDARLDEIITDIKNTLDRGGKVR
jgi:DNA-binding response OmpR family regulator